MVKEIWYAVDGDGSRWLYHEKPTKNDEKNAEWYESSNDECIQIYALETDYILNFIGIEIPSGVTFDSGPVKIEFNVE